MPHRLVLYDAMRAMANGYDLLEVTQSPLESFRWVLDGVPEVHIITDMLLRNSWIEVRESHPHMVAYRLTLAGRHEYMRGKMWYNSLSWWQKLKGRLGLPYAEEPEEYYYY